ncbi:MAG: hypothetical protein HN730_03210, partial [Bdellovibrionales bacterium]|nr:hypothetical protein [Bdellovibrionales bacterium]
MAGLETNLTNSSRCPKCLMPSIAVEQSSQGCSYCLPNSEHDKVTVGDTFIANDNSDLTIEQVRELTAKSTGKYDCLVGITGGRDSSFLLYYTKKVLGLNPLAVNFSTGFQTPEAVHNMSDATTRLGVDFIRYSINRSFMQKIQKGFFTKYGEFCSPCHKGHHYTLAKFARENGIKVIIRGISSKVDLNKINPDYFNYFCQNDQEFSDRLMDIASEFGITKDEIEFHQDMIHLDKWKSHDVLTIDLPDMLEWNYQDIQSILDSEFDWKYPEKQFFHCDCKLNPTLCYMEYCDHGYSEKQIVISNLLANGDIDIDKGRYFLEEEEVSETPDNIDSALSLVGVDRGAFKN